MHPEVSSYHLLFRLETQESSGRDSARRARGRWSHGAEGAAGRGRWLYAAGEHGRWNRDLNFCEAKKVLAIV